MMDGDASALKIAKDPNRARAIDLAAAIRAREISCVEVMQLHLSRIAALNPRVNAIVSLRPEDELLAEAAALDRELAAGACRGWMHGLPHAVKDLANVAGLPTTFGSPIFKDNIARADDIIVERIKAAGAIIIGKTNTPEFGKGSHTYNTVFGTTLNAYDQGVSAGGSSGGAAVAVALGLQPVADGGDMMGSLRNPAGWNNIYSLRPSFGRVPSGPDGDRFYGQLGVLGPMARCVDDLGALMATMAGFDRRAPLSLDGDPSVFGRDLDGLDPRGLRIGYLGSLDGVLPYEPGVEAVSRSALARLEALGCVVDEARCGFDADRMWTAWTSLRALSELGRHEPLYRDPAKRALLKPEVVWEIERALDLTRDQIIAAMADRSAWHGAFDALFDRFDVLALPSAQVFPFPADQAWPRAIAGRAMDTYHRWMQVMVPAALVGAPVVTVPAGFSATGLPLGLQLIGPAQADRALLRLARAYEPTVDHLASRAPPILATL